MPSGAAPTHPIAVARQLLIILDPLSSAVKGIAKMTRPTRTHHRTTLPTVVRTKSRSSQKTMKTTRKMIPMLQKEQ